MTLEWVPPGTSQGIALRDDLVRLYGTTYSTVEYFDIFHCKKVSDCWLLRMSDAGELKHVLVVSPANEETVVLNEMISLERSELELLSDAVFEKFPAPRLSINRIRISGGTSFLLGRRGFRFQTINDAVLGLPRTAHDYRQMLGSQTRKHITYYLNRLRKAFPDFRTAFVAAGDVSAEHIDRIVEMNRGRLRSKGGQSSIDRDYEERLLALARAHGVLCICYANGKIIAGSICTKVGNDAYLHVIAHDVEYDGFNAGQVCLYNSILYLLEMNCARFHMLWGRSEYKYRFGARDENLVFFRMYRSGLRLAGGICAFVLGRETRRLLNIPAKAIRKVARHG